jgi:hypothetical protein
MHKAKRPTRFEGEGGRTALPRFFVEIDENRNVPVAFILKNNTLLSFFTSKTAGIPFGAHARCLNFPELYRGCARSAARLYATDAEYSADARWKGCTQSWKKISQSVLTAKWLM